MRDKGGSDLDVFNSLTKGGGARGQSVVGAPAPESHGAAPPPPPSLRETHYDAEEVSVEDELDETDLDAPQLVLVTTGRPQASASIAVEGKGS